MVTAWSRVSPLVKVRIERSPEYSLSRTFALYAALKAVGEADQILRPDSDDILLGPVAANRRHPLGRWSEARGPVMRDERQRAIRFLRLHREEIRRRLADEAGDEDIGWRMIEIVARAELVQTAFVHHRDPVRERQRLHLVVGDEEHRAAQD